MTNKHLKKHSTSLKKFKWKHWDKNVSPLDWQNSTRLIPSYREKDSLIYDSLIP